MYYNIFFKATVYFSPRSQNVSMVPFPLIETSPLGSNIKVPNKSSTDLVDELT